MRAPNKQQHQTLTAGLEPGTERLIMTKVLPAKRAAIEAFTDRRVRPGFTDVNDPYTHWLREIERRIDGTGFANAVDRDDLTCRGIAQVDFEHQTILATTNPTERQTLQHALPQTVIEGFVRNKFPKLRHKKNLPSVIMDPAGRPFALDPDMQVLVDFATGEESGQTPSVIGAFPNRNPTMIGIETSDGTKRLVEIPEGDTDLNHILNFIPDTRNPTHITIQRPGEDPVIIPMPSNSEVMRMLGLDSDALAEAGGGAAVGPQDRLFLPDRRPERVGEDPVTSPVAVPDSVPVAGPGSDPDTILGPGFDPGAGLDPNLNPGRVSGDGSDTIPGPNSSPDPDPALQPTSDSDPNLGPTDTGNPSGSELTENDQENIAENQSDLEVLRVCHQRLWNRLAVLHKRGFLAHRSDRRERR